MQFFVTGATGVLGGHLVPGPVAAGHGVTATTRTPGKVAQMREAGSEGGPAPCYRMSQLSYDRSGS